jgi:competence protein ComEC
MAHEDPRPRAGRRAAVLGARGASGSFGAWLGDLLAATGEWLAVQFRAEADAARLAPWLPVAFGAGILLYFAAPSEPSPIAAGVALALLALSAWISREHGVGFAIALALAFVAAGFAASTLRAALVAHPVLTRASGTVTLTGFVETRDATERSDRIVLRITGASARGRQTIPERVRVALRRGSAPPVGTHVEAKARLRPLLGPVRPGGYDYARGAYFARLGATGFVLGKPVEKATMVAVPWDIRAYATVDAARRALAERIRSAIPGEAGSVAIALVTGLRDSVPPDVNEAMRVSGLYHVLSISGLHMALVAGTIFATVRGLLALVPALALRRPIKKWAAVLALAGAAAYLVLSGAEVATQRSFLMIALVLCGVLIDRPALTLRTLSAAALVVLALTPEALLHPSFQMSFAATLAIVALYERYARELALPPQSGGGAVARTLTGAGRWLLLGVATSFVAGLATAPYVAFHFHRLAPFGVLANLLAMPLIAFVIMPAGLMGVLLIPFGYDALAWAIMGWGIDGMLAIARWVAALPAAEGRVAAFGAGALLVGTAGLLVLAIPISRLKLVGVPLLGVALALAWSAPRPDVYVDADGETVAVRGTDGKLSVYGARRSRLAALAWLAADADARGLRDDLAGGFSCDANGCVAKLGDGALVAVALRPEAFADDCRDAALVVSRHELPAACAAPGIDRRTLATTGAVSLRRVGGTWVVETARSPLADRPWFGRAAPPDPRVLARLAPRPPTSAVAPAIERGAPPADVPVPDLPDGEMIEEQ